MKRPELGVMYLGIHRLKTGVRTANPRARGVKGMRYSRGTRGKPLEWRSGNINPAGVCSGDKTQGEGFGLRESSCGVVLCLDSRQENGRLKFRGE